ncbi:phage major capsid protein [Microbacterium sp.]|uniref:phage major capsid protein n=1 Tax=Microbacterium sp. TaxID=51671 RepID=UPI003F70FB11
MPSYTYPVARPEGTLTTAQIHLLLNNPTIVAKRVAELAKMRFIADFLLTGRWEAKGGGIFYETGEEIFTADAPESVAPGASYPKTVLTSGEIAAAKTDKRGLGTDVTDEKISREGISYVNKGLQRLVNGVIKDVDSIAMAIVLAKVTSTYTSAAWTTAGAMAEALLAISGTRADLGTGLNLDTVVLKPSKFAKVIGKLIDDKALPREQGNIVITGQIPVDALGFTWATSPFYTSDNPLLVDREQLGGMADEKIESPEFRPAGDTGVEVASDRAKGNDKYELRARRVTVPVVTEPLAGVTLTSTGL